MFEDNDIFGNAYNGVDVNAGENVILPRNRINKNGHHGVWVHNRSSGTVLDNNLRGTSPAPRIKILTAGRSLHMAAIME